MEDDGPPTVSYTRCLGHLLRDLREHRGLVQRQVCHRFTPTLDQAIYSNYEKGTLQPPLKRLGPLAAAFGVDRDDVIIHAYLDSLTPPGAPRPALVDVDRSWLVWAAIFTHIREPLTGLPGGGRCCDLGLRCLCAQDGTCLCDCLGCHVEPTPDIESRADFVSGGRPKVDRPHLPPSAGRPRTPEMVAAIAAAGGIDELGRQFRRNYEAGMSLDKVAASAGVNRNWARARIVDAGGEIRSPSPFGSRSKSIVYSGPEPGDEA